MSDLKLIEAGCGPERGPKRVAVGIRKAFRKVLRPWLVRLDEVLRAVIVRLDKMEWDTRNLEAQVSDLTQEHWRLVAKVESRIDQLDAIATWFPGVDARLDALEEKLSAFQALHWDHVALCRRLAAIEDVLSAGDDTARATLEEGGARPLLPFPGLDAADSRTSKVS